jgi:predicted DsbA family dithiol-disulfide isomerase
VGQVRLHKAIHVFHDNDDEVRSSHRITVEWKPYMIDPGTAPNGEEFEAYNRRRWGSAAWTYHLKQEGCKDGARFDQWTWWPNTQKAHQFIEYFSKHQHHTTVDTDRLNQILFQKLYEQGANISLVDTLVDIAVQELNDVVTTPEDIRELRNYLEQDRGWGSVQREIKTGRNRYNIRGVPYFVIETTNNNDDGRRYAFSGAQFARTFVEIFRELKYSL